MLLLQGHSSSVQAVAFSPDGALLASASHDRTVRLWDASARRELRVLADHKGPVECLAFAPDSVTLASGSLDETVRLWDPATGELRHTLPGHWPLPLAVAFAPDGRRLAAAVGERIGLHVEGEEGPGAARGGEVKLWDTTTGEWRADLMGRLERQHGWPLGAAWSLAYSPGGETLAVGMEFQRAVFWDLAAERIRTVLELGSGVRCLTYSPDGTRLAFGAGWAVLLYEPSTSEEPRILAGHRGHVTSLAFAPDGRTLLSGSFDRTVKTWDVASGREQSSFDWQLGRVNAVAFAPDGMTAAAAGQSGGIIIWDIDPF